MNFSSLKNLHGKTDKKLGKQFGHNGFRKFVFVIFIVIHLFIETLDFHQTLLVVIFRILRNFGFKGLKIGKHLKTSYLLLMYIKIYHGTVAV